MDTGSAILQCGRLDSGWGISVRSQKAFVIRETAAEHIRRAPAGYRFSGIPDHTLALADREYVLQPGDVEDQGFITLPGGAVFFDQTPYIISIQLQGAADAYLFSPLASWCDSADWDPETKRLIVPLNFGNDLGDFELCWEWISEEGERHHGSMSAQVFSSKLDIYSHFQWMLAEVNDRFTWIKLDLLRQTTWGWSSDSDAAADLNTWLVIFQRVRTDMEERLRKLIEQHRRRLVSETHVLRAEQIRRMPRRLEEKVAAGLKENPRRRYPVSKKVLDADTPENRYIKHILFQTHNALNEVIDRIEPVERVSPVFKERLGEWSADWAVLKQHRFWKGVGSFHGLRKESLVLSQDPLYAGIRRSWYLLQQGLMFLDQDLRGGIQNAAQLYEIWCLVKIMQVLDLEGWFYSQDGRVDFEREDDDFGAEEVRSGAVKFEYKKAAHEHVRLDLLFQPTAGANPKAGIWDGMMAVPVEQQPDIVLRLHRNDLPHKPVYTWIFDAKYRIKGNNAPDDAVNQMHRYRDAILWREETAGTVDLRLTRESIGSFVLYPGEERSGKAYPQVDSISKTNIGAFPLKPSADKKLPDFLTQKLSRFLEIRTDFEGVMEQQAEYFASVPGVKRKSAGVIAVAAVRSEMNKAYWKTCRLYRLPVDAAANLKHSPDTWEYVAPQKAGSPHFGVFPVKEMQRLSRKEIEAVYKEQGVFMKSSSGKDDREYFLFRLDEPISAPADLDNIKSGMVVKLDEDVL